MSDAIAIRLAPDVTAAARGDQHAFARLVEATQNTVTSISLAILRDTELSEEAVRQRLLRARRRLSAALTTEIELTAPDATFTAAVLASVAALAAPATASAAVVSAAKAAKGGTLLPGLLGAGALGALAGLAAGLASWASRWAP